MRTRAERRKNTWKKANRQVEIEKNAEGVFASSKDYKPLLKFKHAYSKNKVPYAHPTMKTGFKPDICDQKKLDDMTQQEEEFSDAS